jgi:hypoxanthine phosphoribosyltransferase
MSSRLDCEHLSVFVTQDEIFQLVGKVADTVDDWKLQKMILVPILKAAHYFAADLSRVLSTPHRWEYLRCQTTNDSRSGDGVLKLWVSIRKDLIDVESFQDADVLIVDTLADTGRTAIGISSFFAHHKSEYKYRSLSFAFLLERNECCEEIRNLHRVAVGKRVSHRNWLVGYGLDLDENLRHLPLIAEVSHNCME